MIALRNEYESKLVQKDVEIRQLKSVLDKVKVLLGVEQSTSILSTVGSDAISLWKEKLGDSMAGKIFSFLVEKSPMKFTRPQLGTATGYAAGGGSFSNALSLLKTNNLVMREGDYWRLNSDL